jgi:hypothetical protein
MFVTLAKPAANTSALLILLRGTGCAAQEGFADPRTGGKVVVDVLKEDRISRIMGRH